MSVQCKLKEHYFIGFWIIYILLCMILDYKISCYISTLTVMINYFITDTTICLEEKLDRRYARNL